MKLKTEDNKGFNIQNILKNYNSTAKPQKSNLRIAEGF